MSALPILFPPSFNYMRGPAVRHVHITSLRSAARPLPQAALRAATRAAAATLGNAAAEAGWYNEDGSSGEDLLELLRAKQPEVAASQGPGAVYLVGTGPGDPGLLTLKAVRLLQTAHVVLYDRLVSEDILRLVSPSALMVYVGKQRSYHTRTQTEIHELLRLFAADAGAPLVVRLKGGDPFVFGRGGEEAEYLQERGVSVYCVPGITAAAGIAAELGIPLTHRGLATSVRFLTGHARDGGQADLDEAVGTAVDPHTTLVVYMGLATLGRLSKQLTAGGLDADTPAAAVERGTTPQQRVVWATLGTLGEAATEAALQSPTLIVIGKVVAVAQGWKRAQATGRRLEAPGAHHLPLPVLPGVIPTPADLAEEQEMAGWRML